MDKVLAFLRVLYDNVIKPLLKEIVRRLKARAWDFFKPLLKLLGIYFLKALGILCLIVLAPLLLVMFAVRCGPPARKKTPEEAVNDIVEDVDDMDTMMDDMGFMMGWPMDKTMTQDSPEEGDTEQE